MEGYNSRSAMVYLSRTYTERLQLTLIFTEHKVLGKEW